MTPHIRPTATGLYFTIEDDDENPVPSHTPGWQFRNVLDLAKLAPKRTSDPDIIPGADGVIANPLYLDGAQRLLIGQAFGARDGEGVPWHEGYGSEMECLQANLDYLEQAWSVVPDNTDSTRAAVLHRAGGATSSGRVQVRDLDYDDATMPRVATLTLELFIPAGYLPKDPP